MDNEMIPTEAETLREKVEAASHRLAERTAAAKPVQTVKGLIEEHPVASVAAGILLGALVASALPSVRRRPATVEKATSGLRTSAGALASVAGKLALDYASKAREAGREGLHKVEEVGGRVGHKIADTSADAKHKTGDLAEIIRVAAIEASEVAIRKVNELASRAKH